VERELAQKALLEAQQQETSSLLSFGSRKSVAREVSQKVDRNDVI